MNAYEMLGKIVSAIGKFIEIEASLLDLDVNERSLTHMLALHLSNQFIEWHVDCEYNRFGDKIKRLPDVEAICSNDVAGRSIFPDIIIHRRGKTRNLLAVEFKKTSNAAPSNDIPKLKGLTKRDGDYAYKYGLRLVVDCHNRKVSVAEVYVDGSNDRVLTCSLMRQLQVE